MQNNTENSAREPVYGPVMHALTRDEVPIDYHPPVTVQRQQTEEHPAAPETVPEKTDTAAETSAEEQTSPEPLKKSRLRDVLALVAVMTLFALYAAVTLPSEGRLTQEQPVVRSFTDDVAGRIRELNASSLETVFELPKVYILPWCEGAAPKPNESCYGEFTDENGVKKLTYIDETITVHYWSERLRDSNCHFAEVWIAHPTQLRTALAGGTLKSSVRYTPQKLAQQVNAVVAINGDYAGYRTTGLIIRQGTTYRTALRGWDVLLIDSEGDFHIMRDTDVKASGILDEYDIVNTLEFGPSLIVDGELNMLDVESGCGREWNTRHDSPRTGLGQIGRLHYLMCCIEGRTDDSAGVLTKEIGEIMLEKGCVQAYNLDGGMSTTMVLGGKAMNVPMWGGQRAITDIVYFATALPDGGAQ